MGFPRPSSNEIDLSIINSDPTEPLNYLAWINDLATFGDGGYVYNDTDKMNELLTESANFLAHGFALASSVDSVIGDVILENSTACATMLASPTAITELETEQIVVPTMTDFTVPSGEASASNTQTTAYAWKAFDGDTGTGWNTNSGQHIGAWIAYKFTQDVWCFGFDLKRAGSCRPNEVALEYSADDGSNWNNVTTVNMADNDNLQSFTAGTAVGRNGMLRIKVNSVYGETYSGFNVVQFYCR